MKRITQSVVCGLLTLGTVAAFAAGLVQVEDDQLSEVNGQDGVNLNLKGFSLNSAAHLGYKLGLTLTYTMPYEGNPLDQVNDPGDPLGLNPSKHPSYIQYSNFSISRTDPSAEADLFLDPYQIQLKTVPVPEEVVLPTPSTDEDAKQVLYTRREQQVIQLLNPKNPLGEIKWNASYFWTVAAADSTGSNVVVREMGRHIVEDMVIRGGGISLAPAWSYNNTSDVRGAAFGLDLNVQIGALILRTGGRDAEGVVTDGTSELALRGIKIGAANASKTGVDNTDPAKTWTVADVILQPGIINAYTGADGKPVLRMGIEWYRGKDAENGQPDHQSSVGALSIDQITFKNGAGASQPSTSLGGFSIGGIEIRYLDVVFRNPY